MLILEFLELSCTSLSLHLVSMQHRLSLTEMQKGWFRYRPDVTHNTSHHAQNKPLFMWTPPCSCMYIDNMDTGHRVLSALIAEQELQHSGLDSTHGWKIEPRDEIWSFVAFCATAVCSRSGTGVKQTHLMQKNRSPTNRCGGYSGSKLVLEEEAEGEGGGQEFLENNDLHRCKIRWSIWGVGVVLAQPGWQESLDGQWWEKWTKGDTGGGRSIILSIFPLCCAAVAHLSVLQGLGCDLQQPCIYGVANNLWQFHLYNKVLRQRRSLFIHSDLRAGCFPSRITSLISIIVKHTPL